MTRLNQEDLARFAEEWRAHKPDADAQSTAHVVALEILGELVGKPWTLRMLGKGADPYFVPDARGGSPERVISETRLVQMAHHLYELKSCEGFDELIEHLSTREMFGASAELLAAHMFKANGHTVRFVPPTRRRGGNFDQVVFVGETAVSFEVKAKVDETVYSRTTVESSLRKARGQLPAGGPGVVVLRIPMSWPSDPLLPVEIDEIMDAFFRNTSRVNAVLFMWDELYKGPGTQFALVRGFRWYSHPSPASPVDGIETLIPKR